MVVLAIDHLEVAFNPNLRAKSPPLYQMCHSTAKLQDCLLAVDSAEVIADQLVVFV